MVKLYTIPTATRFMPALARYLDDYRQNHPDQWHKMRLYLPNRRAGQNLRDCFLRLHDGAPLLLPRMHALGQEEDDITLRSLAAGVEPPLPAISPVERNLVLSEKITHLKPELERVRAMALAEHLGTLIDRAHMEGVDPTHFDDLVDGDIAEHWQITLDFLKTIMLQEWPDYLAARSAIDPGAHARETVQHLTDSVRRGDYNGPIILAGSMAPYPHLLDLLDAIAHYDQGQVILPGFNPDHDVRDAPFIAPGHPDYFHSRILDRLNIAPQDVILLPGTEPNGVDDLSAQWMRPAETTPHWRDYNFDASLLDHVSLATCESQDEEALTIAVLLRETLETAGKTASLITPDRLLAARVCAIMRRWGVTLDDTGGEPLAATALGRWAGSLLNQNMVKDDPVALLAMMKNAYSAGGIDWPLETCGAFRNFTRSLDLGLRQETLHSLSGTLATGWAHLKMLLSPLLTPSSRSLAEWASTHIEVMEALADLPEQPGSGPKRLWIGTTGESLANLMRQMMEHSDHTASDLTLNDYASILGHYLARETVRPTYGTHPRLSVLGLIESRFATADRVILGGLNEDVWPAQIKADPFLSRPMQADAGFDQPEKQISLSAHDFIQCFSGEDIILTRSEKIDNAPTIPSRWLSRLDTMAKAGGGDLSALHQRGEAWLTLARTYDRDSKKSASTRPIPSTKPGQFPSSVRITDVDILLKDPYSFYAKNLLRLRVLDPLIRTPNAADKGTLIHTILQHFVETNPQGPLPHDAVEQMEIITERAFESAPDHPIAHALWKPKIKAMIPEILTRETTMRDKRKISYCERKGEVPLTKATKLVGKADRLDELYEGGFDIIDYKTGNSPSKKAIQSQQATQLPLEAAILALGGFAGMTGEASALTYWHVSLSKNRQDVSIHDVAGMAMQVFHNIQNVIRTYEEGQRSYPSCPYGQRFQLYATQDYAYLARLLDWAGEDEEDAA